MKKLTAILLLAILVFNWVGYRFVSNYFDYSSDRKLEAKLDLGDYNEEDLVEMKVPISLPYLVNWNNFERVNGQIEIDGIHYKYVKRKVHNDSLVLMCLPNTEKTKIQDAKSRFFALVNDLNTTDPAGKADKKRSANIKSFSFECMFRSAETALSASPDQKLAHTANHFPMLLSPARLAPERPPASA